MHRQTQKLNQKIFSVISNFSPSLAQAVHARAALSFRNKKKLISAILDTLERGDFSRASTEISERSKKIVQLLELGKTFIKFHSQPGNSFHRFISFSLTLAGWLTVFVKKIDFSRFPCLTLQFQLPIFGLFLCFIFVSTNEN